MSEVDAIIAEFLSDAPVGETKEIIQDLQVILGTDVTKSVKTALEESISKGARVDTVELSGNEKLLILSAHNKKGIKFYDGIAKKLFNVKHSEGEAIDVEDDEEAEESQLFEHLKEKLESYVSEHFPLNESQKLLAFDIFGLEDTIYIVFLNTKRNSANFVNGNWVSCYKYSEGTITGEISVDVHYFEDGNVRLKTTKHVTAEASDVDSIIEAIKKSEEEFELALSKKIIKLNEVEFKALRRPLPVTRAKINWGKAIGNYRLGKDVNNE